MNLNQIRKNFNRLVFKHSKYLIKYPGITPRVINNYFNLIVLKKPVLRSVEFALTYNCQCKCKHCSAYNLRSKVKNELSAKQISHTLKECIKLGALNINLTGGEALYREDLPTIIQAAKPDKTVVSLATNGIMLNKSKARMLRRNGISIVTISLDSPYSEEHDNFRGYKGCFDKVFKAADNVKTENMDVFFCAVATPNLLKNRTKFNKLLKLAQSYDAMLTLQLPCPVGKWLNRQMNDLDKETLDLYNMIVTEPGIRWEGGSNYLKEGCPAGFEKIYITPNGEVMPCNFTHTSYGNISEVSVKQIYNKIVTQSPFNQIHSECIAAKPNRN